MSAKVSFSYKNDTIDGFHVTVHGIPMHMRIEAINNNVAKIYATDVQGNQQPMPPSISLSDAAGTNVAPYKNEFLVTWIDSYILKVSGVEAIWMTNQKQQAFKTAPGITHFQISEESML
ncbi:hypothetical protein TSOC_012646 [Tetrabaena socialis]|uniref:Uncharacterized protein n=1 Tax=Tetrabaena socialis TaxID=47790 RepID=A0A2J7ZMI3_9CHLO|nr:hypothetical protein TSOC_012646 [Tetrabaena socialis]|eukprot:PNH01471.1 hypothetical protein TSOC_012646 [Tetrabaena socialis]